MTTETLYDVAVIGGGLAGLSLAIQLSGQGKSVILFEKESYPFHKVCGEYISLESWDFLQALGLPLRDMQLPIINKLQLSAPKGSCLSAKLPLGGFGISRYALDAALCHIAKNQGVHVQENTKVEDVVCNNELFTIKWRGATTGISRSTVCCGAFGKKSNLDAKWKRSFLQSGKEGLKNYIGVKYHVLSTAPADTIALHNFDEGYCGFSKIEGDKYCLCYMTTAENLKRCNNNIAQLENEVLYRNPHIKMLFQNSTVLASFPITISQINFHKKKSVEKGVLMLGDAAGTITPLCGNGMSIALHSSKLAAHEILNFLNGTCTRGQMETGYTKKWQKQFGNRLKAGRVLQQFFGNAFSTAAFVMLCKAFPFIIKPIIRKTHGSPF